MIYNFITLAVTITKTLAPQALGHAESIRVVDSLGGFRLGEAGFVACLAGNEESGSPFFEALDYLLAFPPAQPAMAQGLGTSSQSR